MLTANTIISSKKSEPVSYDRLLIAAGSSSFVPPIDGADHKGVFALRTMKDAIDIVSFAESSSQVVVIGGGLLGLETAKHLKIADSRSPSSNFSPTCSPVS